jgi:chemotaxis-related protein WspB
MLAIVFKVGEARFALPCQRIIKVIPLVALAPAPHAPAGLLGSLVYRGALTPVLDLCQLLAGYPCPRRLGSRIILSNLRLPSSDSLGSGLLAEDVTEARHLTVTPLAGGAHASGPYLGETVLEGGSLLRLLDVERLLAGAEATFAEHFNRRLASREAGRESTQP